MRERKEREIVGTGVSIESRQATGFSVATEKNKSKKTGAEESDSTILSQ